MCAVQRQDLTLGELRKVETESFEGVQEVVHEDDVSNYDMSNPK